MASLQADVLVVGAGPAGCTLALNLAPSHRVLLLDVDATPPWRVGENLPAAARRLLADMGLWQAFEAQGHLPCPVSRSTWGSAQPQVQDALRNLDGPGWHLNRPQFDVWLRDVACQRGAALLTGVQRVRLSANEAGIAGQLGGWRGQVERPGATLQIQARYVVDATGRTSGMARQLGAQRHTLDKLVCGWVLGKADASQVMQTAPTELHAEPDGWWYSAALPEGQRLLAFYTDADLPAARYAHTPVALLARAASTPPLQPVLQASQFEPANSSGFCAAHSAQLSPFTGRGWLAVGDAALSFDPLSSQGLFNALYTGLAGAQAVHQHLTSPDADADGDVALAGYAAELARIQASYQQHLHAWYGDERRWEERLFWQRRHGGG